MRRYTHSGLEDVTIRGIDFASRERDLSRMGTQGLRAGGQEYAQFASFLV